MSSRFLSFVLRHRPEKIGLELGSGGWADIDELLAKAAEHGVRLSRAKLEAIVANNDKQRFAISADGQRIRANQGHSFPVDLGLAPVTPPPFLYHGTAVRFLDAIQSEGLHKRKRHHVHLSPDWETAVKVGQRHGKPIVLKIRARQMHQDGHPFFRTANNVWLTDHVPPRYFEGDEE